MKRLPITLAFFLLLICCEEKQYEQPIIGRWEWFLTDGVSRYPTVTPETLGYTMIHEYKNNGDYFVYDEDMNLLTKLKFEIKYTNNSQEIKYLHVSYDTSTIIYVYTIREDTLNRAVLLQLDSPFERYKRID